MFCPRCRIEKDDKYCENCGGEMIENKDIDINSQKNNNIPYPNYKEVRKRSIKLNKHNFTLKRIVGLSIIVVLVMGGIAGYTLLSKQSTPRSVVDKYCKYLSQKDYDSAYKMLTNTDNKFLSKEFFKSSMEGLSFEQYTIKNYSSRDQLSTGAEENNVNNSLNMFLVQAGDHLYPVSVVDSGKKFLVFKDYKINAEAFSKRWDFIAPSGANISVLDKGISKRGESTVNNLISINSIYTPTSYSYEISHIFNGVYDIKATMNGAKDINLKGVQAGKGVGIKFEPTDDVVNELHKKAKSYLELYYSNAPKEKYSELVTNNNEAVDKINFNNSEKVTYSINDLNPTEQSLDDVNHASIKIEASIDYEDSSLIEWGMQKQIGTKDISPTFYFEKQDGEWLIVDTSYIN